MEGMGSVYILTQITGSDVTEDFFYDSSVVYIRRDDFTPIWACRKIESELGYYLTDTRYNKTKAQIRFETINGK